MAASGCKGSPGERLPRQRSPAVYLAPEKLSRCCHLRAGLQALPPSAPPEEETAAATPEGPLCRREGVARPQVLPSRQKQQLALL